MEEYPFIVYNHPDEQKTVSHKHKVAQHVGTYFRNRSGPSTRVKAGNRPGHGFIPFNVPSRRQQTPEAPPETLLNTVTIPRDRSGVRQDPFCAYPTKQSHAVDLAVDHFIHSYAPSHLFRPELGDQELSSRVVRSYFQHALEHKVMFQATIALALADASANTLVDNTPDRNVLFYYGQSISTLRQCLLDTDAHHDDALLFAIMALIGVDYLLNDLDAFGAHLMGLRKIIRLRGGLNEVGFASLLKPSVALLESFWTYICSQPRLVHPQSIRLAPSIHSTVAKLIFHCEPYVGSMLSKIPPGYHILADKPVFGPKILSIVYHIVESDTTLHHRKPTALAYHDGIRKFLNFETTGGNPVTAATAWLHCGELGKMLASSHLSQVERTCCIGLFIYLLGFSRSEQLSPIYFAQLQFHTQELLCITLTDDDPEATELSGWAMLCVSSTLLPLVEPESDARNGIDKRYALALKVVEHFSARMTWEQMRTCLTKFIWNESCMSSWQDLWHVGIRHLRGRDDASAQQKSLGPVV